MNPESNSLQCYAETGSQDAFAQVVARYVPIVYGAALRRVGGDRHSAQDVTQLVFVALARNAASVSRHPDLTGWLFTTAHFLASKARRTDSRRREREKEAGLAAAPNDGTDAAQMAPGAAVDDVLIELKELDRQIILLRFYRGLRLAEIGAQLNASENAVQKRLDRALDQLRRKLERRGATSSAAAIALALEQQSALAVPAGLAAAATTAGVTCASGTFAGATVTTLMAASKIKIGIAAAIAIAATGGIVQLEANNVRLRQSIAQEVQAAERADASLRARIDFESKRAETAQLALAQRPRQPGVVTSATSTTAAAPTLPSPPTVPGAALRERGEQIRREQGEQAALAFYVQAYRATRLSAQTGLEFQEPLFAITGYRDKGVVQATLNELRDEALSSLASQPLDRSRLGELALLNDRLGYSANTVSLLDALPANHEARQGLALKAFPTLVELRRYNIALEGKSFPAMLREFEIFTVPKAATKDAADLKAEVDRTLNNIEVLAGVGQLTEARLLAGKLTELAGSAALSEQLANRFERAGQSSRP